MELTEAYIAIEGVIGVGKTTLARLFQQAVGARLVLEVFEENPFLSDFYTDRSRYAFQTQIFFLLSRYHQQRQLRLIPRPVISDYMFEKDRLFAQVNLRGDELQTYYSVQEALAENIARPDLVVYLKASTETLMDRIIARDRTYERNMDPAYLDSLRTTYDAFFAAYDAASVLTIDTNDVDFVKSDADREAVFARIRGALGEGPRQPALPGLERGVSPVAPPAAPYVATPVTRAAPSIEAPAGSSDASRAALQAGLAEALSALIKLADAAGVDLPTAALEQLRLDRERVGPGPVASEGERP